MSHGDRCLLTGLFYMNNRLIVNAFTIITVNGRYLASFMNDYNSTLGDALFYLDNITPAEIFQIDG